MRRRDVIVALGSAAVFSLLTAHAQQPGRVRRVGALFGWDQSDPDSKVWLTAFQEELQRRGWEPGPGIRIDYRFGAGDNDRLGVYAAARRAAHPPTDQVRIGHQPHDREGTWSVDL